MQNKNSIFYFLIYEKNFVLWKSLFKDIRKKNAVCINIRTPFIN